MTRLRFTCLYNKSPPRGQGAFSWPVPRECPFPSSCGCGETVNTAVLKTAAPAGACGFDSHHPHHHYTRDLFGFCLAQRASTAFRALSLRSSGVSFLALAGPPFFPPKRPRATAAGFFFLATCILYVSGLVEVKGIIILMCVYYLLDIYVCAHVYYNHAAALWFAFYPECPF